MAHHAIKKWLQHSWNHFYGLLYFRNDADFAENGNFIIFPLQRLYDADDHDDERRDPAYDGHEPPQEGDDAHDYTAEAPKGQANALVGMMPDIIG